MPGSTAIHDLSYASVDGDPVFASSVRTNWGHRLAERVYLDVAGVAHDWTGRDALKVSLTLHFLETIRPNLYIQTWPKLRDKFLVGKSFKFRHPELGVFPCRVVSVAYEISADSTAGVSVELELTESIESADQPTKFTAASSEAAKAAEDADVAIEQLGIAYPDGMVQSSFGDMLNQLNSFDDLLAIEVNGFINQCKGYVDSCFELLQLDCLAQDGLTPSEKEGLAASPFRWLLETSLDTMSYALGQMADAAQSAAEAVQKTTAPGDTTLAALSLTLGVPVGTLIRLNPGLLGSPKVKGGSTVLYVTE